MPDTHRTKGNGSVYKRASDGYWCATLELPSSDGKRRRKVLVAKTQREAKIKLAEARRQLDRDGDLPTQGQTVESWLNVWFTTIALKKIRPKTAAAYRTLLERHIIPTIGNVRLDKLTPAHVRRLNASITDKGLSSTTAMQAHRILAVALKYAEREGRVTRNVATLTDAPRKARKQLAVLTPADAVKVLQAVAGDRLGSRWAAALMTGARQGELLGLELDRVTDVLDLSWQLQRLTWEHGCKDQCGATRAAECPERFVTFPADSESRHLTGGLWLSRPKSSSGWRVIPLVPPLREIIERRALVAQSEPNPFGLLWTADRTPLTGSPIDPGVDNRAWHQALDRAGVGQVRLHDARHTTASLLLAAKVPPPVIMRILGHSSYVTSVAYMDVPRDQLAQAMHSINALMPLE